LPASSPPLSSLAGPHRGRPYYSPAGYKTETVQLLSSIFVPILILAVAMILSGLALSWILHKITGWDYSTCLLASSPGGLTQMSIIADEVGANPLLVSALHTTRLISILTVLPLLFRFLIA